MKKVLTILDNACRAGIESNLPNVKQQRIYLSNVLAYITFTTCVVFMVAFLFVDIPKVLYISGFFILNSIVSILILNRQQYYQIANFLHLSIGIVGILSGYFLFPHEIEINILFFFLLAYPWLFFDLKEKRNIIISLLMIAAAYIFVEIGYFSVSNEESNVMTQRDINIVKLGFIAYIFIFLNSILYFVTSRYYQHINHLKTLTTQAQKLVIEKEKVSQDLEKSLGELEKLAYASSHDLKMPLRSIISFSQLLKRSYKKQLNEEAVEYLDYIVSEGKRQFHQIEGLIEYLKAGQTDKNITVNDSNILVGEVLESFQNTIETNKINIIQTDLHPIQCDKNDAIQVFENVLSNAVKFSINKNESAQIYIKSTIEREFIVFEIKDSGIGFDMQYNDQMFGIFKTLSADDKQKGSGIGLSICKKIVKHYGGDIWATSKPNQGATFYFTFPKSV